MPPFDVDFSDQEAEVDSKGDIVTVENKDWRKCLLIAKNIVFFIFSKYTLTVQSNSETPLICRFFF